MVTKVLGIISIVFIGFLLISMNNIEIKGEESENEFLEDNWVMNHIQCLENANNSYMTGILICSEWMQYYTYKCIGNVGQLDYKSKYCSDLYSKMRGAYYVTVPEETLDNSMFAPLSRIGDIFRFLGNNSSTTD